MSFLFLWIAGLLLIASMPMVYLMLLAPGLALIAQDKAIFLNMLSQRLFAGLDSFPLMALPFFILAGELMNASGIIRRMFDFANSLVGHRRGGLAQVSVGSSIMLAGGCGSSVADASALGTLMIPAMEEAGYTRRMAAAVVAASSVIVSIIPPSGLFILYAFIMNVSVASMFAGGVIPGLLFAVGLMVAIWLMSFFKPMPRQENAMPWKKRFHFAQRALLPLATPIILIGGIIGGVFTPTEGAAVAAAYSLLLGLLYTRELKIREIPRIFAKSALNSAVILMLVAAAVAFASVVSLSGTPQIVANHILALTDNVNLLFFLIMLMLLITGTFMDAGPAILILGPILAPVMTSMGVDPIHFGVVMCINLIMGLITPPMGLVLFVVGGISRERIELIAKDMLPLFSVEVVILFGLVYFQPLVTWLPSIMN